MKEGLGDEPGLGEELYNAMEKGGEMPDIVDEDLPEDDAVLKCMTKLIVKMTSYHASDRPSAQAVVSVLKDLNTEVNPLTSEVEHSPALRLLQALNDKRQAAIDESVAAPNLSDWINDYVDLDRLDNSVPYLIGVEHVTCLTFASYVNDARTVRQLVEAGCDVAARDSSGQTPLHTACWSDVDANSKVVFLLQRDASLVNASDYSNESPLHGAAGKGNSEVVKMLLDNGADVDARGQLGRTALHAACEGGHVACIHELMAGGAQIEARDSDTEATPLHLAAHFNHPDSVKALVNVYKASINATNKRGNNALHQAAGKGHVEVVKTLLSFDNCDDNAKGQLGRTALHHACSNGHVACIHELMAGGANIEARGNELEATPLHLAAQFNHPDCVKTLVDVYKASQTHQTHPTQDRKEGTRLNSKI